ncbi:MAG: maltotransferase domain-containing protein [Candidatus Limnocylindria bacterium]
MVPDRRRPPATSPGTREPEDDGRRRVVIDAVAPAVASADGSRYAVKRVTGEALAVEASVFADGHEQLRCVLRHRPDPGTAWREVEMRAAGNDRWAGEIACGAVGRHVYSVTAWIDPFATWSERLAKRIAAGEDLEAELRTGASIVRAAAERAGSAEREELLAYAARLDTPGEGAAAAAEPELERLMRKHDRRAHAATLPYDVPFLVERERARFSTWYELFPRSAAPDGHGTLAAVRDRLPLIQSMGFDVLYLPPIHPIGGTDRRGPNNMASTSAGDPGSPWAIGAAEGGHDAVHPQLGTHDDVKALVADARARGIDVALDLAFQCSPDHPYVREHPEWFRRRPDGTIQFAENPPKKYRDIYPFDFETDDWRALWAELLRVTLFWVDHGIRAFRVDNPHTKPFAFWEWLIGEVRAKHPDMVFLSEAFTRPNVMYRLAKLGFTQSYTYFAWRTTKSELTDYFTELTRTPVREYFRPNLWPNTPDILTEQLQYGGRPAFVSRLVLAATLGASYGVYGPAFELAEHRAVRHGSEEYLDSEKYQLRSWDWSEGAGIREIVTLVNRIRRENRALQADSSLRFHTTDSDALIAYSKRSPDGENVILTVVNLDPHHTQSGFVDLDLAELGVSESDSYQVHDLLGGGRYLWRGSRNYVELQPETLPAHVFAVRRRVRTERDFDYFE